MGGFLGGLRCFALIVFAWVGLASGSAFAAMAFSATHADVYENNETERCSAHVTYGLPTLAYGSGDYTYSRTAGPESGSDLPVGDTTVTYVVTDNLYDEVSTVSFTLHVLDTEAPVLTAPTQTAYTADAITGMATVTSYAPTVADNCGGYSLTLSYGTNTYQSDGKTSNFPDTIDLPVGDTNFTATLNDTAQNSADPLNYSITVNAAPEPVNVNVNVTLVSSANPSAVGQAVTFNTQVYVGNAPTISGNVEFFDGDSKFATVELIDGYASASISSLTEGAHNIRVHFAGNKTYDEKDSEILVQDVSTDDSDALETVQDNITPHVGRIALDRVTQSIDQAITDGFSDNLTLLGGSQNGAHVALAPGMQLGGKVITPTADVPGQLMSDSMWRFWADVHYTGWEIKAYDGAQLNGLFGATARVSDGLLLGLVAGYETFNSDTSTGDSFNGDGKTVGGYLGWRLNTQFRLDAQATHTWLNYDGTVGAATGAYDASRETISGGLTHDLAWQGIDIQSSLRASGVWENQDSYVDSLAVLHGANNFNYGTLSSGAKISHRFVLDDGSTFTPFISAYTDYRFANGLSAIDTSSQHLSQRVGLGAGYSNGKGMNLSVEGGLSGLGANTGLARSIKATLDFTF